MSPLLELHGCVRSWAEDSLRLGRMGGFDRGATAAYIDLLFAFGWATRGESAPAGELAESARRVLEGFDPAEDRGIVGHFLLKAFHYRVGQALSGRPHASPLSPDLTAELDRIHANGNGNPTGPHVFAHYAIQRMRAYSRILEPLERIDLYAEWMNDGDKLRGRLAELLRVREPDALARAVGDLYRAAAGTESPVRDRLLALGAGLSLAVRVGEAFAVELLRLVPEAVQAARPPDREVPELAWRQADVLERALLLAVHFGLRDEARRLVDQFIGLVRWHAEEGRYGLVNATAAPCVWSLRQLGLVDEIDRLVNQLREAIPSGRTPAEVRQSLPGDGNHPDLRAAALQSLLHLAGGCLMLGRADEATPVLGAARDELLEPDAAPLPASGYTALAGAYVAALGHGPADVGPPRIAELFRSMDPTRITNNWTTSKFYSRFHLTLSEETVLAVSRAEPPLHPTAAAVTFP